MASPSHGQPSPSNLSPFPPSVMSQELGMANEMGEAASLRALPRKQRIAILTAKKMQGIADSKARSRFIGAAAEKRKQIAALQGDITRLGDSLEAAPQRDQMERELGLMQMEYNAWQQTWYAHREGSMDPVEVEAAIAKRMRCGAPPPAESWLPTKEDFLEDRHRVSVAQAQKQREAVEQMERKIKASEKAEARAPKGAVNIYSRGPLDGKPKTTFDPSMKAIAHSVTQKYDPQDVALPLKLVHLNEVVQREPTTEGEPSTTELLGKALRRIGDQKVARQQRVDEVRLIREREQRMQHLLEQKLAIEQGMPSVGLVAEADLVFDPNTGEFLPQGADEGGEGWEGMEGFEPLSLNDSAFGPRMWGTPPAPSLSTATEGTGEDRTT